MASRESAVPITVSRPLASVEPGDRFVALLGEKRIAGLRNLRRSRRLLGVPGEATRHHPASRQHRARRRLGWRAGTEPWADYSSSPETMSNRPAGPGDESAGGCPTNSSQPGMRCAAHRANVKISRSQLRESGQHITGPLHVSTRFALGMGCDDIGKPVSIAQTTQANSFNLAAT